ncbi:hypothetical protein BDZ89DRAFT_1146045 [Hymenopellis radicata]|nr:hypothetical protein BDZ89DRAFT_1146045 [Hymenopellis radicata]
MRKDLMCIGIKFGCILTSFSHLSTLLAIWILLDSVFPTGLGRFDGVNFSSIAFTALNSDASAPLRAVHCWDNDVSAHVNATLLWNLACIEMLVPTDSLSRPCSLSSMSFHPVEFQRGLTTITQPSVNFAADVDLDLTDPGFTDTLGRVGDQFRKSLDIPSIALGSGLFAAALRLRTPRGLDKYVSRKPYATLRLSSRLASTHIAGGRHRHKTPFTFLRYYYGVCYLRITVAADGDLDLTESGFMDAFGLLGDEFVLLPELALMADNDGSVRSAPPFTSILGRLRHWTSACPRRVHGVCLLRLEDGDVDEGYVHFVHIATH